MNQVISILFISACVFASVSAFPAELKEGAPLPSTPQLQRSPRQVTYNWVARSPYADYAGVTYYPAHSGLGYSYGQPYPHGYYGSYGGHGMGYHYSLVNNNNNGYHHQAHYQHA
ncbi:unnamed protein product [Orchesella dallaii]|uniref:Uncharacterized protein n=1 Tax=Orchesella dallaii TaxID=48710 RepID=A0ABP1RIE3_9HEXA